MSHLCRGISLLTRELSLSALQPSVGLRLDEDRSQRSCSVLQREAQRGTIESHGNSRKLQMFSTAIQIVTCNLTQLSFLSAHVSRNLKAGRSN